MNRLLSLSLSLLSLGASPAIADQKLYLTAGGGITVYAIDESSGKLSQAQSVKLPGAAASTFSEDGRYLYTAGLKGKTPQIATLTRGEDGLLTLQHNATTHFRTGYLGLDRSGQFLAGNHYPEGKVSLWKLEDSVYRGELLKELVLEKKVHGVNFSKGNQWLLVPATEPNKVFINAFDPENGTLTPHDPPFATGPTGEDEPRQPRHLIFHPSHPDIIYTTCEQKEPGICVWKWDEEAGTLAVRQHILTQPEGFEKAISTSTLHLTPNEKFLYLANRVKAKSGGSTIVGFRVNPEDGQLSLISHTPCEEVPRSFCIEGTGKFLYVAGRRDRRLGVYAIDQDAGTLTKVQQLEIGKGVTWMKTR